MTRGLTVAELRQLGYTANPAGSRHRLAEWCSPGWTERYFLVTWKDPDGSFRVETAGVGSPFARKMAEDPRAPIRWYGLSDVFGGLR